jgi:halimadienyl-diphosphate synthase
MAELDEPIGEEALEWLRENQLEDGSWGAPAPKYYHDRLICTLAAMTALARHNDPKDKPRWERAYDVIANTARCLTSDPAGATVGFEMIAPTLMTEAQALGTIQQSSNGVLDQLTRYRAAKISSLPGGMVNRHVTAAFSAEMAGPDGLHLLDADNLQESNGSVGLSPSATAYFALYVRRQSPTALAYLRGVIDNGTVPHFSPYDIFERAWTLWNLSLIGLLSDDLLEACQPHLDFLQQAWIPGKGLGFSPTYTPNDSDDTSLVYEVLKRFGRDIDLEAVLRYETTGHFRTYMVESNPSISANIHVLGALREAGLEAQHPAVQKVLAFLRRTQTLGLFWLDKWHTSPYYATAHAIIAAAGLDDNLLEDAIYWILETQNADGSWGYYMPTAEETAYCLQALVVWKRHGHSVDDDTLKRGAAWLADHAEPPYPPLWIVKCLYCPVLLVHSAILSALTLVAQE